MKPRVAKISLIVAAVFFISDCFVLCACPGWYAVGVAFAGVAVWASVGRMRRWAVLWLVASLLGTVFQTLGAIKERHRYIKNVEQIQRMRTQGTNASGRIHTASN